MYTFPEKDVHVSGETPTCFWAGCLRKPVQSGFPPADIDIKKETRVGCVSLEDRFIGFGRIGEACEVFFSQIILVLLFSSAQLVAGSASLGRFFSVRKIVVIVYFPLFRKILRFLGVCGIFGRFPF